MTTISGYRTAIKEKIELSIWRCVCLIEPFRDGLRYSQIESYAEKIYDYCLEDSGKSNVMVYVEERPQFVKLFNSMVITGKKEFESKEWKQLELFRV